MKSNLCSHGVPYFECDDPMHRECWEFTDAGQATLVHSQYERIQEGELCFLWNPETLKKRMVCVLEITSLHNTPAARVCLVTNEVDMMTAHDALLAREETNYACSLVAQLSLAILIPMKCLCSVGTPPYRVSPEILEWLQSFPTDEFFARNRVLRGMPTTGPTDPRWKFQIDELSELQGLANMCQHLHPRDLCLNCRVIEDVAREREEEE